MLDNNGDKNLFKDFTNDEIHTFATDLNIADDAFETLCQNMRDGKVHINSVDDAMAAYNGTLKKVQVQQKLTSAGAKLMSGAMKVLSSVGWMLAITLVTEAISWVVEKVKAVYEESHKSIKDLTEEIEESASKIKSIKEGFDNLNKSISTTSKRFAELAQEIDTSTGNHTLSTEEYEEFLDLSNQLADSFSTLPVIYDENGNAIVQLSGDVDTITESLQQLLETERELANQKILEELPELYKTTKTASDKYDEEINKQKDFVDRLRDVRELLQEALQDENFVKGLESGSIHLASYDDDYDEKMGKYTKLLGELGLLYTSSSMHVGDYETGYIETVLGISPDTNSRILSALMAASDYEEVISNAEKKLVSLQNSQSSTWNSFKNNLLTSFASDSNFQALSDQWQMYFQEIINSLNFEDLDYSNLDEATVDILKNLLIPLSSNNEKYSTFQDLFNKFMTLEEGTQAKLDVFNKLQEEMNNLGLTIPITPMIEDTQQIVDNLNLAKDKIARDIVGVDVGKSMNEGQKQYYNNLIYRIDEFAKQYSINTQDEISAFYDAYERANGDIEKAFEYYLEPKQSSKLSFTKAFNSVDFKEHKEKLLDLAKSGELTLETLSSTEEYATLLSNTGLTAEEVKDEIYDLLTAQEKLAGAHNGIDDLTNSYKEFKDLGFVTAQTLEDLPDVFKSLDGYDIFSQIVGDPQSGTDKIQQAFNDIVKEYLIFTQTLNPEDLISNDLETQQRAISTYIANLKEMGITNAEEVVNQTIASAKQQQTLIDKAEAEYIDYLRGKNDVELQYIESTSSYNAQFINSLGEGYETDYNNWLNLLKDKELAYQRFVKSLDKDGDGNFVYDPSKNAVQNLLDNGYTNITSSNLEEFYKAKSEYDRITKKYEELRRALVFNPTTIEDTFSSDYDGDSSSSSKDAHKEEFDRKLKELKHMHEMNLISDAEYYNELDKLNQKYFANRTEYLDEYRQYEEEVYKGLLSVQEDSINAIEKLIDLRIDMIKDIKEDEIDALEKAIDAEKEKLDLLNEQIDARKKAIELAKDEADHEKELTEKNKSVSDIQAQIDAIKYDNSASAQKKRRELEEQLADAQKDLADYISDYEYDKAIEALDKESEAYEKAYEDKEKVLQDEIDKIEAYLDDEKKLMEDAINDINGMNNTLFESMKNWAYETTGSVWEVVDAWKAAKEALETYNATNNVSSKLEELNKNSSDNIATPTSQSVSSGDEETNVGEITSEYKAIHIVEKGDTPWELAKKYYGSGKEYTKILDANNNIKTLRVGQKLIIPYASGTKKVPYDTLALVDELGEELMLNANVQGRLTSLTKGTSVIPADITENLMKWGEISPSSFKFDIPDYTKAFKGIGNNMVVNVGDININGDMGNLTVSDLNKFRKDLAYDVMDIMNKNRTKSGRY